MTAVLFIVFNRPDLTRSVFSSIRQARPKKLYIAADGPRIGRHEAELISETRAITKNIDWPCDVMTLFHDENLGCRDAVSSAIDWFFSHEEEGIILEDDCLPHPTFFRYCSELLEKYRDVPKVMSISGSAFVRPVFLRNSYDFTYYADMWGWATWRRAWRRYDVDMKSWPEEKYKLDEYFHDREPSRDRWSDIFDATSSGEIDTWDYQWIWTVLRNQGLCVTPHRNMIKNLGFGINATHTKDPNSYLGLRRVEALDFPIRHKAKVTPSYGLERDLAIARLGIPPKGLWHRIIRRVRAEIINQTTYSGKMIRPLRRANRQVNK